MTGGPFALSDRLDNIPLDNLGGTADLGADATDNSADVGVNGANDVAANAAAGLEIGAVPDAVSAGQAAIRCWRSSRSTTAKSAGTVQKGLRSHQANNAAPRPPMVAAATRAMTTITAAATGGGMGGGTSLMDVLGSLLSAGSSGIQYEPSGQQGAEPVRAAGHEPFGDPYGQQGASTPAALIPSPTVRWVLGGWCASDDGRLQRRHRRSVRHVPSRRARAPSPPPAPTPTRPPTLLHRRQQIQARTTRLTTAGTTRTAKPATAVPIPRRRRNHQSSGVTDAVRFLGTDSAAVPTDPAASSAACTP